MAEQDAGLGFKLSATHAADERRRCVLAQFSGRHEAIELLTVLTEQLVQLARHL